MMEARKASPPRADDLALYALAQARVVEVKKACDKPCKDCPGPGMPGGCEEREAVRPKVVAGRADWPLCPLGLLRVPVWQDIVDLKRASKVSPIAGFPDCLTAGALHGLLELQDALAQEDERQIREAQRQSSSGGPNFSGRRVARGVEG